MSSKRFLITGGAGFIGSALTCRLHSLGHQICILDDNSRASVGGLLDIAENIEFLNGSVCDADFVQSAVKGVDCVVHLAAINGTETFYTAPERVLDVGVRGIINIVDACRDQSVGELIVASSSEVYQTPPQVPTPEDVPLVVPDVTNPRYSYGASKIISEMMALWHGQRDFDRMMIFRPHNVYGPEMGWEHVVPQFVLRAAAAVRDVPSGPVPFPIQGDGSQTRAFTFVDDCIDGIMSLVERGRHLGIYHIGNPEEVTIGHVARQVFAHFGREVDIRPSPEPPGATPRRCPDITRIKELGFEPKIPFRDGLPPTAEWYVANAHLGPEKVLVP